MGIRAWVRSRYWLVGLMMALVAASPAVAVEIVTSPVTLSFQADCERAGTVKLVFGPEDMEAMYFRTTTSTHKSLSLRISLSSGEVAVPMCSAMAGSTEGTDGDRFVWPNSGRLAPLDSIGVTVSSLSGTGAPDITAYAFGEKGAAYFDIYITAITKPADWSNLLTRPWLMVGKGNGRASATGDNDTDIFISPAAITASAPLRITVTEPEFGRATVTGDQILATSGTWNGAIPKTERDALEALYADCGGASWAHRNQWLEAPGSECGWYGVTCGNGHVTRLELEGNGLTGSLPAALGNLSALTVLDIKENALTGTIPAEFTGLTSLLWMDLSANQLEGPIPEALTRLTQLEDDTSDFRYNRLFTDSGVLRSFLNRKQVGGDWESTQDVVNEAPTLTITSIQPRTDGSGRIDIQFIGTDPEGDTVTWYEPQVYCTSIAGPKYDETAAWPLVFVPDDPANTAGAEMIFPSKSASFHLVVSATDWASGFYKLRLKVADPAGNHSNYDYSDPFYLERGTVFTGCPARDQALAFPACALEGVTGEAVLLRISTTIQEPVDDPVQDPVDQPVDYPVDVVRKGTVRESADPALTTLAVTYFTLTLDGVSLPMDGKPVLEYNKTAGRWEVAAYHCTGPLTEGSHEVVGTVYTSGVAQPSNTCRFTAETPAPYILDSFHLTYVVAGTGSDTGKLTFAVRHVGDGYVTEDVLRGFHLYGPDGGQISLSDPRLDSSSTRAGVYDPGKGAWVYDGGYTSAARYEALFEPPLETGTYRLVAVDASGRSYEAETTVSGPVVRLPVVSTDSFSFEDTADGGLLWRFEVPDTAGTGVETGAVADLFTGDAPAGTLLLNNPSDPASIVLPPDVVSLIRTSGNHARLKVHLSTPDKLNHSWSLAFFYPPNQPPAAPVAVYPANGAVIGQTAVLLQASAFSDPDADAQAASYWKVRERDGNYGDQGLDPSFSGVVREGTMTAYTVSGLVPGVAYVWRVGYEDAGSGKTVWSGESGLIAGQKSQSAGLRVGPGVSAGDFQMVSMTRWVVPATAPAVFGPSIGTYDTTRYRIGAYDPAVGNYVEYGDALKVPPGRAVWFFAREGMDLVVEGIPVSPTTLVRVALDFNASTGDGWNQVAPPNEASYDWKRLMVYASGEAGIAAVGRLGELADDNPYVDKRLWRWENGAYQADTSIMEPFEGCWARARKAGVYLGFAPDAQVSSTGILQTRLIREIRDLAGRLVRGPSEAMASGDNPPAPPAGFTSASSESESAGGGGCFIQTLSRP